MKKLITSLLFVVLFGLFSVNYVLATNNPLEVSNNIYGIHLTDPSDLQDANNLVNTNGGAWGYVTFVIPINDQDKNKWQKAFDEARRLKLIPIIRIATAPDGAIWQRPDLSQIDAWVDFLNSLNWVIQNRYVIIGNEPNHSKEWGGNVNPEEYAIYLKEFSQKLKSKNSDFFVLPAGLDASAPTSYINKKQGTLLTLDEIEFLTRMLKKEPNLFDSLDGWTSHSYPNPGFVGPTSGTGRLSVRAFEWELDLIKTLGVSKNLPVFITETGWVQKLDGYKSGLSEKEIGERLTEAYQNAWSDKRIVAVTPFILNYPASPFGNFSWKSKDDKFYEFYSKVAALPKIAGEPIQIDDGQILGAFAFPLQLSGSNFSGFLLALNKGQSIWEKGSINLAENELQTKIINTSFETLEPGHLGTFYFEGKTPEKKDTYDFSVMLVKNGKNFGNAKDLKIISESSFMLKLYPYFNRFFQFTDQLKSIKLK